MLCRLICASLTEDRYGVVQRDIPKIIEALLSFLTALEDYQAELNAKYTLPGPDKLKELPIKEVAERETLAMEAARASEVLSVVSDGTSAAALIVPSCSRAPSLTACEHDQQQSRTGLCRSCGRLGRSCLRSSFRRGSRRSCRASWTTIDGLPGAVGSVGRVGGESILEPAARSRTVACPSVSRCLPG